jgi:hypothetical protein
MNTVIARWACSFDESKQEKEILSKAAVCRLENVLEEGH